MRRSILLVQVFALLLVAVACNSTPSTPVLVDDDLTGGMDLGVADQAVEQDLVVPECKEEECSVENEWGVCFGIIMCEKGEAGQCDALVPASELCNGVDDDCDGQTDEGEELCDDSNPCTQDSCDGEAGCQYASLDGVECDDGDQCTEIGACAQGVCQAPAVVCSDDDPCTDDTCDPGSGCVFTENSQVCDDLDPCTVNDLCHEGECTGFQVPCDCQADEDCIELEDGDLCNGTLLCDLALFPPKCAVDEATIITCPEPEGDGADCLDSACDAQTGECSLVPANEGKACFDSDACTLGEKCLQGECTEGIAANCNDGNPCTDDLCDSETGCIHADNTASCEDGSICTTGDYCSEGQCQPGAPIECDDGNVCTNDTCNEASGCVHAPNDAGCDDGSVCTLDDQCQQGICVPGPAENCDDSNPCTEDVCSPVEGCQHTDKNAPCDDLNACTSGDTCLQGECLSGKPTNCDDGDPCTTDACEPDKGCYHDKNSEPCQDGDVCTVGDLCENGKCVPGTQMSCDDGNACTDDSCDPAMGCVHTHNDAACDDNNECTGSDQCVQGKCIGQGSADCDDANPCTKDICLPLGGCVHEDSGSALCDDGDPCTQGDVCQDGVCTPGAPKNCNDYNPCTDDSCQEGGNCVHQPNQADCNDNNECTAQDACLEGSCQGGVLAACDDDNVCTTDSCDPKVGCLHVSNQAPCNDGNVCTLGDQCMDEQCESGATVACDDGNPCTDDSCDPLDGCKQAPNQALCDDGNPCTEGDACVQGACKGAQAVVCNDDNPCTDDWCHPFDGCTFTANNDSCDDNSKCTLVDQCADGECLGEQAPDCDDGDPCTDDLCDPELGCVYENNSEECDDGDACTVSDLCVDGQCVGFEPLVCADDDPCTQDSCAPESGCVFTPIVPCCGNGVLDEGEECDQGIDNGKTALDACTDQCHLFGAYELVLSVANDGSILAGSWDDAYTVVVDEARDCKVRFDNRLARVTHLEFTSDSLRFDFQDLNAWHNSWDSYAYLFVQPGLRAGLAASYRRGHDNEVWKKSAQQHNEYSWQGTQIDLYCERENLYTHVATIDGAGNASQGSWSAMHGAVDKGATCKVKYDGRLSTVSHTEYTQNRIYFDLLGLHAQYNGWDSYAYLDLYDKVRGGIAAAYRRGYQDNVWMKDRSQHAEAEFHVLTTAVYCKDTFTEEFIVLSNGGFTKGDFETLHGYVADEARDCKVFYDGRVTEPAYIEYTDTTLRFDFMHLHAYHDQWDSFAGVMLGQNSYAGIRVSYRKGHVDHIWKKTLAQHAGKAISNTTVRVRCEGEPGYAKVYEIDGSGKDVFNKWAGFHGPLASHNRGFDCKVRYDGRVTSPPLIEHGLQSGFELLLFDELSLGAFHDGWDAYATNVAFSGQSAGIGASYRRGHHNVVWKRDRQQSLLYSFQQMGLEYFCK